MVLSGTFIHVSNLEELRGQPLKSFNTIDDEVQIVVVKSRHLLLLYKFLEFCWHAHEVIYSKTSCNSHLTVLERQIAGFASKISDSDRTDGCFGFSNDRISQEPCTKVSG